MPILIALGMLCFVVVGAIVSACAACLWAVFESATTREPATARIARTRGRPRRTRGNASPKPGADVHWQEISSAQLDAILEEALRPPRKKPC